MTNIKNIIFDLGGVLIDWNPEYLYLDVFDGDKEKVNWFLETICTMEWNENQDAGNPLKDATAQLISKFPEHSRLIEMYYGQWSKMLGGAIEGSVELLRSLTSNPNYKVVALTNWSHETFPIARQRFEFLNWFEGIIVSGEEKTRKPFKEIYQLTLDKFQIKAEESVFIDDNLRNIKAAEELGIIGIHFKSADQLYEDLKKHSISINEL